LKFINLLFIHNKNIFIKKYKIINFKIKIIFKINKLLKNIKLNFVIFCNFWKFYKYKHSSFLLRNQYSLN